MEQEPSYPKIGYPKIVGLSLAIVIVFVMWFLWGWLGWCGGDADKTASVTVIPGFATQAQCRANLAGFVMPAACNTAGPVVADFNAWVAAQTCTPHWGCAACQKLTEPILGGQAVCQANGAAWDLVCTNLAYELDCDCP